MFARIRKSLDEKEKGFTLIELLVVMIIIGILAAIAIPVFLNQRTKATEASAKADASVVGKEIATYYVDGLLVLTPAGTAPTWTLTDSAALVVASGNLSAGNVVTGTATSGTAFCVTVTPSLNGAGPWSFGQNGLKKGAACP